MDVENNRHDVSIASHVEIRGEWFYVNGEAFVVKGIGYSPYRPGQLPWSTEVSLDVMKMDFARIQAAGFNTLRTWAPLTLEQLALAKQYELMVLQGIWVDPKGNYASDAFHASVRDVVYREVARAKESDNVLAFLIGNELSPKHVLSAGLDKAESLLKTAYKAAKQADNTALISYANWPRLAILDTSFMDVASINLYPYEPISISHAFGFWGYVEFLKRTKVSGKPLIITETGLSVSPRAGDREGYGGYSVKEQAKGLIELWDAAFAAGAQGACLFEWNDEWWKNAHYHGDENKHDENDPEEWFGLVEFSSANDVEGILRPAYNAIKAYNNAILISPSGEGLYQGRLPVSVYVTDAVDSVRVRIGSGKWQPVVSVSKHWWKANINIENSTRAKHHQLTLEAHDDDGNILVRHERMFWTGLENPPLTVTIETGKDTYEVGDKVQTMEYVIKVTDANGHPLPSLPVQFSISEPQANVELAQSKLTDDNGLISGSYLVREPGLIYLAAAAAPDRRHPEYRLGDEHAVFIKKSEQKRQFPPLKHEASAWEEKVPELIRKELAHEVAAFKLFDPGTEIVVDYEKYGTFHGVGTSEYRYEITDRKGLAKASGEGVYPNENGLLKDPAFRKALLAHELDGNLWDFTDHPNVQLSFLRWASATEESPGVKQFFTAMSLERAGLLRQAIKAYYAVLIHFPKTIGWTEFQTPWYVGKVTRDKITAILRLHPELNQRLEGARVIVENGFDNDVDNDVTIVYPGRLVQATAQEINPETIDVSSLKIKQDRGNGRVRVRQYENGHWQLLVEEKPWLIKGIIYSPIPVGESYDENTVQDWMVADRDQNGRPDSPFDTFVDANRNNKQDADEPAIGDFQLLKDMGVNTIRIYHHDQATDKQLLRQLYEEYGIMVLMGDLVGKYTVGSGASWEEGTNYLDPNQLRSMSESVKRMVREFKDEPYVLMWVLGNENNYGGMHGIIGGQENAGLYPKEYYSFLNDLAEWIHQEDPNHPVAISNGEWMFLDIIAAEAPAIDIFGANVYRGSHGFGLSFFEAVRDQLDRPVFITEFGCPSYQANQPLEVGEVGQALYNFGSWVDLIDNVAGRGVGNVLGGSVFEFVDEWWKAGQPPRYSAMVHEVVPNWSGPFPGGKNYEEWFGVTSLGDGSSSPFLRQLRLTYELYRQIWN